MGERKEQNPKTSKRASMVRKHTDVSEKRVDESEKHASKTVKRARKSSRSVKTSMQPEVAKKSGRNLKLRKAAKASSTTKNAHTRMAAKVTVNEDTFAKGLGFKKLFCVFIIGSVFGTIYEDILIYVLRGEWMLHRAVIYGPFNMVYGLGAALMCWALMRKKYAWWEVFGLSAILGGVLEYVLSLGQEIITGTTSWDYSHQFLNIHGRTSIPLMLVWGFLGLLLVKVIYPFCSRLIEKIPPRIGNPVFWAFFVFIVFDCLISWSAVIRQTLRHQDIPPLTPIGEFYDNYYTDEFLRKYYPNMERKR